MSTTTQPPDITAHLDAAERAAASLVFELRQALDAVPADDRLVGWRCDIEQCIKSATRAVDFDRIRADMVEIARPKGPDVTICYPARRGTETTRTVELASITGASFVMRGGERYSRRTGQQLDHAYNAWTSGAPYITEAERARVLALPRLPAPTRPRKEPRS